MTQLVKLRDEKELLTDLREGSLVLVRSCPEVKPMKLLISSYEILDLTLDIQQRFPRVWPDLPECDEAALLELLTFTRELYVFWRLQMPQPDFDRYSQEVKVLLNLFQIPRGSR